MDNWDRLLKIIKWSLSEYDRNNDGLIEQGQRLSEPALGCLVGEPENSFIWTKRKATSWWWPAWKFASGCN